MGDSARSGYVETNLQLLTPSVTGGVWATAELCRSYCDCCYYIVHLQMLKNRILTRQRRGGIKKDSYKLFFYLLDRSSG